MKTLTHFLDTPKRSEISALLKPLPISSTTCDSRRLNIIGRSSLTAFRLLRFLFIVQKSFCLTRCSNMQYWEVVAEAQCCRLVVGLLQCCYKDAQRSCSPIIGNYGSSAVDTRYIRYAFDLVIINCALRSKLETDPFRSVLTVNIRQSVRFFLTTHPRFWHKRPLTILRSGRDVFCSRDP